MKKQETSLGILFLAIQGPPFIQLWPLAYKRLLNKPYENEVTFISQNLPLKCCQSLELLTQLKRGIDL